MKTQVDTALCFHCGDPCPEQILTWEDKPFCCEGCKTVYRLLHDHELEQYYCMTDNPGAKREWVSKKYPALDKPELAKQFIHYADGNILKMSYFLPQIHCSSCIWLLEHLHKLNSGVLHSAVNFTEKKVFITVDPAKINVRQTAELLSEVGYDPLIEFGEIDRPSSFNQDQLSRIGIVGFCFANIMLLSFPEYLGLDPDLEPTLANVFRFASLVLAIPVFSIAVKVFFVNSYKSLKHSYVNIDAPVSLAVLVTFVRSVYEIFSMHGQGYLDSMSGIVFFMLVGRYLQAKTFKSLQFNRKVKSFLPISVEKVIDQDATAPIHIDDIEINDILFIRRGEVVPIDAEVWEGESHIDYSYITGESKAVLILPGKPIFAGGKIIDQALKIKALKSFTSSDFAQLWNHEAFSERKDLGKNWTDRVGSYFALVVFAIAALSFIFWYQIDHNQAWQVMTAILIVACPCALLLSSTYTLGFMTERLGEAGFFLKNSSVLDKLTQINHVVFDKTGTLTAGGKEKVRVDGQIWTEAERLAALSLMKQSLHPLSQSILSFEGSFKVKKIASWREIKGSGLEGWIDDQHFKIGSARWIGLVDKNNNRSEVWVNIDGINKAHYTFNQDFRPGILPMLTKLNNYKLSLLSGDNNLLQAGLEVSLPKGMRCKLEQNPKNKLEYIQSLQQDGQHVMMIGDGLNDAGALKQSDIGIAVVEQYHAFAPACDVIMHADRLKDLDRVLDAAFKVRKLVYCLFGYSILYNLIGLYYAVSATLTPMIAAILMPLSSIGVIIFAFLGSKAIFGKLRK